MMNAPSPPALAVPSQPRGLNLEQASCEAFGTGHRLELKPNPPKHHLQDDSHSATSWKTMEVGYFDGEISVLRHIENNDNILHFHHVVAFVNHLRALSVFKTEDALRYNIHACLRGTALEWFISELSQQDREALRTLPLEEGWFKALEVRFKPCALANVIIELGFTSDDWEKNRRPDAIRAHCVLRDLQVARAEAHPVQWLRELWQMIPRGLEQYLPEPTHNTSILEFMSNLDRVGNEDDNEYGLFLRDGQRD